MSGPILFFRAKSDQLLPPHPRRLMWRYFAASDEHNAHLGRNKSKGIETDGYYITRRDQGRAKVSQQTDKGRSARA
jgi:hypothetical protein